MNYSPISKVLILDNNPAYADTLRTFCESNRLTPLRATPVSLGRVLQRNIDLGAVFMAEDDGLDNSDRALLLHDIRQQRADLPVFMRSATLKRDDDFPPGIRSYICGSYNINELDELRKQVQRHIFCLEFPSTLVRELQEASKESLQWLFTPLKLEAESPCVIRDSLIFGELFSLISLESSWCRGYLMLQAEEDPILRYLERHRPAEQSHDMHSVNALLGESTNLIWGNLKARFGVGKLNSAGGELIQVPLLVNHRHKFISFGSTNPQLCLPFSMIDEETGNRVHLLQRFAFNLKWAPEMFAASMNDTSQLLASGELEMF
jgi:hypothetical protein